MSVPDAHVALMQGGARSPVQAARTACVEASPLTRVRRMHIREAYRSYGSGIGELHRCLGMQGVTVHSGRNVIKAATLRGPPGESIEVAVKAFRVPNRLRGFIYARLRPSKARRSMVHAETLLERGIGTPDPVACIEYESAGCLRESYYICRHWPPDIDLTELLYRRGSLGERTNTLLEQLARFTFLQHESGVQHLDYNPGNILVRSRGEGFDFVLVDLNRLRFRPLDMDDRISGLVRLTTSADYLRNIGKEYANLYGVDPGDFCQRLERVYRRFVARRRTMNRIKSLFRREH